MARYQIFLIRGNDLYIEGNVRMTPDTLVVENEDIPPKVIAEFYRHSVAGWKKAPVE